MRRRVVWAYKLPTTYVPTLSTHARHLSPLTFSALVLSYVPRYTFELYRKKLFDPPPAAIVKKMYGSMCWSLSLGAR